MNRGVDVASQLCLTLPDLSQEDYAMASGPREAVARHTLGPLP